MIRVVEQERPLPWIGHDAAVTRAFPVLVGGKDRIPRVPFPWAEQPSCAGDAELVPAEMGSAWPVVKAIKRALDPNNVMNPGKQSFDEAYYDDGGAA